MQIPTEAPEATSPPEVDAEADLALTMPEITAEMVLAILEANDLAHAGNASKEV
jgi:hypothetical protein